MAASSPNISRNSHAPMLRLPAMLLVVVFLFAQFPYCGCIGGTDSHQTHGVILVEAGCDACCDGTGEASCGDNCHCDICNRGGGSFVLVNAETGSTTRAVPIPVFFFDCPVSIILPVSTLPPRHA